jgi:hypothetical protein
VVHHQQADVGERSPSVQISQSSTAITLPLVVDHAVVEAVVAVDDRAPALLGNPARQRRGPRRPPAARASSDGFHWPYQRLSWRAR